MPEISVNGIRLHYEERGEGTPILCIHGTGSSARVWADAIERLAAVGRVIAYDRRGHDRSERPEPYDRTSVAEHVEDAAALLDALGAAPAIVIGRSYGGAVATGLTLSRPGHVRALALLEPGEIALVPAVVDWLRALGDRLGEVAASDGVEAVGEAMIAEALGEGVWPMLPEELRRLFTRNGAAILVEQRGEYLEADAATLAAIDQPVLLVAASESVPVLRELIDAMAQALPDARVVLVGGGHLIDPAAPEVMAFIEGLPG